MSRFIPRGLGWVPDLPDARDYSYRHEAVLSLLSQLRCSQNQELPDKIDLRRDAEGDYFTPVEDQGRLNSSSAFAVLSLVEYFERRVRGRTFEGSKLFLYQVSCRLMQGRRADPLIAEVDQGVSLRTTLKAFARFGVPPEEHWPYEVDRFNEEPSQFLYGLASRPTGRTGLCYLRLDETNHDGSAVWDAVTAFLAGGFPIACGFSVPASMTDQPEIPYRPRLDTIRGGQSVLVVGYERNHFGRGGHALLVRCSWGSQWGNGGYGWLPMAYVHQKLARDFWTLVSQGWLDSLELTRPRVI